MAEMEAPALRSSSLNSPIGHSCFRKWGREEMRRKVRSVRNFLLPIPSSSWVDPLKFSSSERVICDLIPLTTPSPVEQDIVNLTPLRRGKTRWRTFPSIFEMWNQCNLLFEFMRERESSSSHLISISLLSLLAALSFHSSLDSPSPPPSSW